MNNLSVSTLLSEGYKQYFGFTEDEVLELLAEAGMKDRAGDVTQWYNGYRFGLNKQIVIFNPWSIVMYLNEWVLKPYWVNTSGNAIIRKLAIEGDRNIQLKIQDLLEGKSIPDVLINENIVYHDIMNSDTNIWSFMLMSGYLKPETVELRNGDVYCTLLPPNLEIFHFFRNMMENWFVEAASGGLAVEMLKALVNGDVDAFHELFSATVRRTVSYNDVGADNAESFYHAFVLGMLVMLDKTHQVKSNRESGFGRYDVMIIPRDIRNKGIVIEFKNASKLRRETVEDALAAAIGQLRAKRYDTELHDAGVADVLQLAIAFKGKEVLVQELISAADERRA